MSEDRTNQAAAPTPEPDSYEDGRWHCLDAAERNGSLLTLWRRRHEFVIRVDGAELMSSHVHGSEEEMADIGCKGLMELPAPRVLVCGMGLGYTLAATLRNLPSGAEVVVAELSPEVVRWNREQLGHLAGNPLDDPRVTVSLGDVAELLRESHERFDAILLDVDNGPDSLSMKENWALYSPKGVRTALAALRPGRLLVIWSASSDHEFQRQLKRERLTFRTWMVGARGGRKGRKHYLHIITNVPSRKGQPRPKSRGQRKRKRRPGEVG